MKFLVTIILLITIFSDFTSATFHNDIDNGTCVSQSICQDTDFHSSTNSENHGPESEHRACHFGHSHILVFISQHYEFTQTYLELFSIFPFFNAGKSNQYITELNRPPIA